MVCNTPTEGASVSNRRLEWVKVPILPTVQQIICRVSNRIFVGAPLCAQPFFCFLSVTFADSSQA